jgi:CubicO group peptidase (beta-lactamase class C family)
MKGTIVVSTGTQPAAVQGFIAPGFEAVREELASIIATDPGYSAQFCAYLHDELIVDVWGGPDIDRDSLQGVFSATKGVSAVCIALLIQRGLLDLDAP